MILAWRNEADAGVITAGSEIATLPASNLKDPHVAKKWHAGAGVKATHLLVDRGAVVAFSLLALIGSNLSESATVRVRASQTDATATGALEVDTGKMPAGAVSGYGAVYKRVRGSYLSMVPGALPSLAFDFTAGHMADLFGKAAVACTRAGATATRVNERGYVELVAADTPRFDYDPATKKCRGLLVERSRTNKIAHSADLSQASHWGIDGTEGVLTEVTPGAALSPDGKYNANRVNGNFVGNGVSQGFTTTAEQHTASFYVWGAGRQAEYCRLGIFNSTIGSFITVSAKVLEGSTTLSGGGADTVLITNLGKGWNRISITSTAALNAAQSHRLYLYPPQGAAVFVWGFQLEAGAYATSYIPTAAATVTRNGDALSVSVAGQAGVWFKRDGGTLCAEWIAYDVAGNHRIAYIGDAGGNNRAADLFVEAGAAWFAVLNGGIGQTTIGVVVTGGPVRRMAARYITNDFAMALDGVLIGTDNSGTLPGAGANTELAIGQFGGGLGHHLDGHVRRITYYPQGTNNNDLVAGTRADTATIDVEREIRARYTRIDIEDTTLPDNIQVGRLFLGPHWETPQNQGAGLEFGWGVTPHDPSEEEESAGGQTYPEERPQRRMLQFSLDWGTEQEMYENVFAMARAAGVVRDVLAIPQPDSAYVSEQAVWGQVQAPQPLVHRTSRTFRQQFTVKERL